MSQAVRDVILLEPDRFDARRVLWALARPNALWCYHAQHVVDLDQAQTVIVNQRQDAILVGLNLFGQQRLETLLQLRAWCPEAAIVLLDDDAPVNAASVDLIHSGADDYLPKHELTTELLQRTLGYAIERRQSQNILAREKERFRNTLESISDAVISCNAKGHILFMNQAAEQLLELPISHVLGQPLDVLCQVLDGPHTSLSLISSEGEELTIRTQSGRQLVVWVSMTDLEDPAMVDRNSGRLLLIRDNTQQHQWREQLSYQASHDVLTGLLNRRALESRLQHALETASQEQVEHCLCYLDLDRFKQVNDGGGHAAGDELLRQLAALMRDNIRRHDTIARTGGDEFVLLLEHCNAQQAERVADKLRTAIEQFRFCWAEQSYRVGVSAGLAVIDSESRDVGQVLAAADQACFEAKRAGRNQIVLANTLVSTPCSSGPDDWGQRLRQALQEDRFRFCTQVIQPISETATGSRVELLLRLQENDHLTSAAAFLPSAERNGLSLQIDRWVLEHAVQWLLSEPGRAQQLHSCSINLSPATLTDEAQLSYMIKTIGESAIDPAMLCFEISETAAIAALSQVGPFIQRLNSLGCRFALDNFGSGLSSFSYLKAIDVDYLKIDGSFVRQMLDDPIQHAMVKSINEIGQIMGKQTIAEFVENDQILAQLRQLGVDYGQGYGIAEPQLLEALA